MQYESGTFSVQAMMCNKNQAHLQYKCSVQSSIPYKAQPIFWKPCKGSHEVTQQKFLCKVSKILAEDNKVFSF